MLWRLHPLKASRFKPTMGLEFQFQSPHDGRVVLNDELCGCPPTVARKLTFALQRRDSILSASFASFWTKETMRVRMSLQRTYDRIGRKCLETR